MIRKMRRINSDPKRSRVRRSRDLTWQYIRQLKRRMRDPSPV